MFLIGKIKRLIDKAFYGIIPADKTIDHAGVRGDGRFLRTLIVISDGWRMEPPFDFPIRRYPDSTFSRYNDSMEPRT